MDTFSLGGNWVDLVIIVILVYFVSEAFRVGFWILAADFIGFFLSLLIALRGYKFVSFFLRDNFSLSASLSNAIGFLVTASFLEFFLGFFFMGFVKKIPYKYWKKPISKFLAIFPAVGEGLIIVSFILTLALGIPLAPKIKRDIGNSKIGGILVERTAGLEMSVNEVFGGLIEESLNFLTVKPDAYEAIPLDSVKTELLTDSQLEKEMLNLVNKERRKVGVGELSWSDETANVARDYAGYMWEENYFGHISPLGEDVGDRLEKAGIKYSYAGENLALAPTLSIAHQGLMNSEGHRENILDPEFKKLGVGAVENGIYGIMFVQIFTD